MAELDEIFGSERPEIEKLALGFRHITSMIADYARHEIDLARAMHDQEAVIKRQIKRDCFLTAQSIFQQCHLRATGRRAWNDQDNG